MRHYLNIFFKLFPGIRGVIAAVLALGGILALIYGAAADRNFVLRGYVTSLDHEVTAVVAQHYSLIAAKIFVFFTYLADPEIVFSLSVGILSLLIILRQRRVIIFFILSLLAGQTASTVFKLLIQRGRPEQPFNLISPIGYSFPSGHALGAAVFYGLIGYYFYRLAKHATLKRVIELSTLLLIFIIGISRIYLSVHWSSDVIAGWLMGFTLLIGIIVLYEHQEHFRPEPQQKPMMDKARFHSLALLILIFEIGIIFYTYFMHPLISPNPLLPTVSVDSVARFG